LKLTSLILAMLALAAGLVAAGCGDDDDDEATSAAETEETIPKADWLEQADQICSDENSALAEEARSQYPEGPPTGEDAVAFAEDVYIPNLQSQHDQIAELPAPEGAEQEAEELLSALQAGIDELAADPGSFVESTALDDPGEAAQDIGLRQCGS
jgi:hypothetical protein